MTNILKKIYHITHDLLFNTIKYNPFLPKQFNGKVVEFGHISSKHLENPKFDDALVKSLKQAGIRVEDFDIDVEAYHEYIAASNYPLSYYGGGKDAKQNFVEKTLEHYVSMQFMNLNKETVFVDIAACTSPFYKMLSEKYGLTAYQQDLVYNKGIDGHKIGGYGHELPFEESTIDAVTLHCSLEHFEGNSDTLFFQTLEKQLKPDGVAVVLPFYLASEYTIHTDPIFNWIKRHKVKYDKSDRFRLRYASWYQFFSRHYDAQALQDKILKPCPGLELTVYRVRNFKEVDSSSYLRFVGVFRKR